MLKASQKGLERDQHNPSGGESIAHLSVGHTYHVNTLRNTLKQGREGTNSCLSLTRLKSVAAHQWHQPLLVAGGVRRALVAKAKNAFTRKAAIMPHRAMITK